MKRVFLFVLLVMGTVVPVYAQFTFSSIDFPGGTLTTTRGIDNHGTIVGSYRTTPPRHALLITDGNFIPLEPGSVLATHLSEAYRSNDRGDVVGYFIGDDGFSHGFLLSGGVLTTLDFPGASRTFALGINESGTVVGEWYLLDSGGNLLAYHGYTFKDGTFSQVDVPGAADTAVTGINARGDMVGIWDSGVTSPFGHAFVLSKNEFISFDFPGATLTQANGINASGQIVGTYLEAGGAQHAFLADGATFTTIDFPGAARSAAWGINSAGQIVGNYTITVSGDPHGYFAQPDNKGKPGL
jgi:probable HAF family extracellular repeat protein